MALHKLWQPNNFCSMAEYFYSMREHNHPAGTTKVFSRRIHLLVLRYIPFDLVVPYTGRSRLYTPDS